MKSATKRQLELILKLKAKIGLQAIFGTSQNSRLTTSFNCFAVTQSPAKETIAQNTTYYWGKTTKFPDSRFFFAQSFAVRSVLRVSLQMFISCFAVPR